jgi:hypothetical protein
MRAGAGKIRGDERVREDLRIRPKHTRRRHNVSGEDLQIFWSVPVH